MLELNVKGIKSAIKTVSQRLSQDDRIGGHGVPPPHKVHQQYIGAILTDLLNTSRGPWTPKGTRKKFL